MKTWVSCDATYRVSSDERQGFFVIGTGTLGQHFRLISIALVNREDEAALRVVVRQTFDAVNQVTRERGRRGLRV